MTEWFVPGTVPAAAPATPPATEYRIVEPTPGLQLARDPRIPDELEAFKMSIAPVPELREVEWYVDGIPVSRTRTGDLTWYLVHGRHEVIAQISAPETPTKRIPPHRCGFRCGKNSPQLRQSDSRGGARLGLRGNSGAIERFRAVWRQPAPMACRLHGTVDHNEYSMCSSPVHTCLPLEKDTVIHATRRWLRPAIYVLLLCGVTWNEFCALAKTIYVEVATVRFGKRGRPTNVSRTAMLTGLTRRDVRAVRERAASGQPAVTIYASKASQILSRWHLDPEFIDKRGAPRALPLEGDWPYVHGAAAPIGRRGHSRHHRHARAAERQSDSQTRGRTARGSSAQLHSARHRRAAHSALGHGARRCRQHLRPQHHAQRTHARRASSAPPRTSRFRSSWHRSSVRSWNARARPFLERVDTWLTEHQVDPASVTEDSTRTTRMGAGVYQIQD